MPRQRRRSRAGRTPRSPNCWAPVSSPTSRVRPPGRPRGRIAAVAQRPDRTRRRFTVIVPALIAKFLSAGALAQAATGAGVVVVVAAGAGGRRPSDGARRRSPTSRGSPDGRRGRRRGRRRPSSRRSDGEPADPGTDPGPSNCQTRRPDRGADAFDARLWAKGYDPDEYSSFGAWVFSGAHNKAHLQEALAAGRGTATSARWSARGPTRRA